MPGLNQTGPMGQGPTTGRRMGRCTNFGAKARKDEITNPENQNENQESIFPGRGFGFRWRGGWGGGRGMGFRNRYRGGF